MISDNINLKVSVVIPTLARYESLKRLLESIYSLPVMPSEIIIIDQTDYIKGSGDYPDFSDADKSVQHLKVQIAGPCIARNTGANTATGDILWFLDDDVLLNSENNYIAFINEHFAHYPETVLIPSYTDKINDNRKMRGRFDIINHLTRHVAHTDRDYHFSLGIDSACLVLPRSLFLKLGGFDEKFDPNGAFEDRDLGLRCYYSGIKIYQSKGLSVQHLPSPTGGRREKSIEQKMLRNRYYFWSKYMSEEMYYIQAFAYWLSQPSRSRKIINKLLNLVLKRVLRIPDYHTLL